LNVWFLLLKDRRGGSVGPSRVVRGKLSQTLWNPRLGGKTWGGGGGSSRGGHASRYKTKRGFGVCLRVGELVFCSQNYNAASGTEKVADITGTSRKGGGRAFRLIGYQGRERGRDDVEGSVFRQKEAKRSSLGGPKSYETVLAVPGFRGGGAIRRLPPQDPALLKTLISTTRKGKKVPSTLQNRPRNSYASSPSPTVESAVGEAKRKKKRVASPTPGGKNGGGLPNQESFIELRKRGDE